MAANELAPSQGPSSHGDDCGCTRCTGFQQGNELGVRFDAGNEAALRHGAYRSTLRLAPRVRELCDEIVEVMPVFTPADLPAVELLAITRARIEIAQAALDELDEKARGGALGPYVVDDAPKLQRLRDDLGRWTTRALRLCDALGMTPTSRARLGLDIAATRRQLSVLDNLDALAAAGRATQ
jgi:hypothetical protein